MNRPLIRGMEGKKLNRTLAHCKGNLCECLSTAIDAMLNGVASHGSGEKGLVQHMSEQTRAGASPPGSQSWAVHEKNIVDQQANLRDHIREHKERGCGGPPGGGSPVPAGAMDLARAGPPTAADWGVNNPAAYEGLTGSPVGDAVLGTAALYGAYRVIRFLPSLLPPLWWTAPANALAP
jgi:hypothetical protein